MPKRAVLVFRQPYTDEEAAEYADYVAGQLDVRAGIVWWKWSDTLPDWVDTATADQVAAHRRDLGPDAIYMVIEVDEFTDDDEDGILDP